MFNHRQARKSGFTLLEMVLTISLLSLLAGIIAPIFSQGFTAARITQLNLAAMAKARYAMERMVREIQQMDYNGIAYRVDVMQPSRLRFIKNEPSATEVTIEIAAALIHLWYSSNDHVLCDAVTELSFRYLDIAGNVTSDAAALAFVEITLAIVENSTNATLRQRTRVGLRDYL